MGSCKCIRVNVANINLNGWLRQQNTGQSGSRAWIKQLSNPSLNLGQADLSKNTAKN